MLFEQLLLSKYLIQEFHKHVLYKPFVYNLNHSLTHLEMLSIC